MVAVLGKDVSELQVAIDASGVAVAEIANINAPGQIVVAGSVAGVAAFVEKLGTAKVIDLPVSAPFHCCLMKPAEERLRVDLAGITIKTPKFPVYQNYTASFTNDPEAIRENLALQVCGRVRWVECVENVMKEKAPAAVWEYGAGNVLTGLVKRINSAVPRVNIDSPESLAAAAA
jgi:[acyl-carrier-protein] S-malonyltransferase